MKSLAEISPGDVIVRTFGAAISRGPDPLWDHLTAQHLRVTEVDDRFIYCGPEGIGWKFSRLTGAEVDETLGWTETASGSFITGTVS